MMNHLNKNLQRKRSFVINLSATLYSKVNQTTRLNLVNSNCFNNLKCPQRPLLNLWLLCLTRHLLKIKLKCNRKPQQFLFIGRISLSNIRSLAKISKFHKKRIVTKSISISTRHRNRRIFLAMTSFNPLSIRAPPNLRYPLKLKSLSRTS